MIYRKVVRKFINIEINLYEGFVYYILYYEVLKFGFKFIFLWIVFNLFVLFMGYVFNNYWMKGLKVFNDFIFVLFKFCEN